MKKDKRKTSFAGVNNEERIRLFSKEQISLLRDLYSYDPVQGLLMNNKNKHVYKQQKSRYAFVGTPFGTISLHKLIWLVYYGTNPSMIIDHINHNTADNRIKNLRLLTDRENKTVQKRKNRNNLLPQGVIAYCGKFIVWYQNSWFKFKTIRQALLFRKSKGLYIGF